MKYFLMIVLLTACTTAAHAESPAQKELRQYPRWIQNECLKLTNYRDRKATYNNYPAALQCAKNTVEDLDRKKVLDAELELTQEKIKWLKANRYTGENYPEIEK